MQSIHGQEQRVIGVNRLGHRVLLNKETNITLLFESLNFETRVTGFYLFLHPLNGPLTQILHIYWVYLKQSYSFKSFCLRAKSLVFSASQIIQSWPSLQSVLQSSVVALSRRPKKPTRPNFICRLHHMRSWSRSSSRHPPEPIFCNSRICFLFSQFVVPDKALRSVFSNQIVFLWRMLLGLSSEPCICQPSVLSLIYTLPVTKYQNDVIIAFSFAIS